MTRRWIKEGETVTVDISKQLLELSCCDCGLTHDILISVKGDKVDLKFNINHKETALLRENHNNA